MKLWTCFFRFALSSRVSSHSYHGSTTSAGPSNVEFACSSVVIVVRVMLPTGLPGSDAARSKHKQFAVRENIYWEATIASNTGNPRKLWRSLSTLLGDPSASRSTVSPPFSPSDYLRFMEDKIESVRTGTAGAQPPVFQTTDSRLGSFESCTEDDVRKIIDGSPSKSCDLDPIPTFLVKDYLDTLLPFITRLCNASIHEACLPVSQRKAIITPVIKKAGLDVGDVRNYRPISGLTFMSKVIEKVVARQLVAYLACYDLLPKFQSGFRRRSFHRDGSPSHALGHLRVYRSRPRRASGSS